MNLDKFTIKAQSAVQAAQQLAAEREHQAIENGHLMKGILDADENVLPFLLNKLGVNSTIIFQALDKLIQSYPRVSDG